MLPRRLSLLPHPSANPSVTLNLTLASMARRDNNHPLQGCATSRNRGSLTTTRFNKALLGLMLVPPLAAHRKQRGESFLEEQASPIVRAAA